MQLTQLQAKIRKLEQELNIATEIYIKATKKRKQKLSRINKIKLEIIRLKSGKPIKEHYKNPYGGKTFWQALEKGDIHRANLGTAWNTKKNEWS